MNARFVNIKVDRQERPETAYVCRNRTCEAPLTSAEARSESAAAGDGEVDGAGSPAPLR
jgi:uncharacterized protein YyaL (SSP411 family)